MAKLRRVCLRIESCAERFACFFASVFVYARDELPSHGFRWTTSRPGAEDTKEDATDDDDVG